VLAGHFHATAAHVKVIARHLLLVWGTVKVTARRFNLNLRPVELAAQSLFSARPSLSRAPAAYESAIDPLSIRRPGKVWRLADLDWYGPLRNGWFVTAFVLSFDDYFRSWSVSVGIADDKNNETGCLCHAPTPAGALDSANAWVRETSERALRYNDPMYCEICLYPPDPGDICPRCGEVQPDW